MLKTEDPSTGCTFNPWFSRRNTSLILMLQAEKNKSFDVQTLNKPRSPWSETYCERLAPPGPPSFSLPSTFKFYMEQSYGLALRYISRETNIRVS